MPMCWHQCTASASQVSTQLLLYSKFVKVSPNLSYAFLCLSTGQRADAVGRGDGHGAGGESSTTLAAQQIWLQRQRVLHHEPHPSDADIIELNCGGCIMVTSRSTLRQVWCCSQPCKTSLACLFALQRPEVASLTPGPGAHCGELRLAWTTP
jgi:hypothetical protein